MFIDPGFGWDMAVDALVFRLDINAQTSVTNLKPYPYRIRGLQRHYSVEGHQKPVEDQMIVPLL